MGLALRVYTSAGVTSYDDIETALSAEGETWIHADGADPEDLDRLTAAAGLHPLAIEDITDEKTRPKTESYDTHTFVLMKTVRAGNADVAFRKEIRLHPIGFFLGPDWLVTVSPTDADVVEASSSRWAKNADRVSTRGTDFIAYRLMDEIVDEYFALLDEIEDDIEAVEQRVLDEPDPDLLEELNAVRRDLLAFRKVAWPAREAIAYLSRGELPEIDDDNEKYFRDVYDHLVQVVDLIETYRDLTTGSRDIYLNTVSQSTNDVMKTLTIVATIFIPLTFVAGVYGMNFEVMPELHWRFGYPVVMLGMACLAIVMIRYFQQKEWI
jgi:magnesium transporter